VAISFVEKSQANWSGASGSGALPAGFAQDDLLLAQIVFDRTATTVSGVPTGWALVPIASGANPVAQGTNVQSYWYYKVAGGGETDPAVWTMSDANANGVICLSCYRGVDTADPFDDDSRNFATASGTSHATTAAPVTTANAWAVVKAAMDVAATNSWTHDGAGGWTERYEQENTAFVSAASADKEFPPGTASMTWTSSATSAAVVGIVVLKPAASSGVLVQPPVRRVF
jgi:hypothetical protein